jgi:hypothetical protein
MKMLPQHYAQLKNEIECLPRDRCLELRQGLQKVSGIQDFNKRFRWDLLWQTRQSKWICDVLYSYLNDTHIDTALKQIMKELDLNL